MKTRHSTLNLQSVELTEKLLRRQDCLLIATDHSCYDYTWMVKHSQLVVDTRNATANVRQNRDRSSPKGSALARRIVKA